MRVRLTCWDEAAAKKAAFAVTGTLRGICPEREKDKRISAERRVTCFAETVEIILHPVPLFAVFAEQK